MLFEIFEITKVDNSFDFDFFTPPQPQRTETNSSLILKYFKKPERNILRFFKISNAHKTLVIAGFIVPTRVTLRFSWFQRKHRWVSRVRYIYP